MGEIIAESSALEISVGEIKEKEATLSWEELVLVFDQCRFDAVFGLIYGIGDLIYGVFANSGEVVADKLRECRVPLEGAMGKR